MTSFEIDGFGPEVPGFVTVQPSEAQLHVRAIMSLVKGVLADPNAFALIEDQEGVGRRVGKQVLHRKRPDVMLGAARGTRAVTEPLYSGQAGPVFTEGMERFSEVSIHEPDISLILTIIHSRIQWTDLRQDPIAGEIIDVFRSHLTA